jgi:hypothetical protein
MHPEAYKLIVYRDDAYGSEEKIWNGRDGQAPHVGSSRDGERTIVKVGVEDVPEDYIPSAGMREIVECRYGSVVSTYMKVVT